MEGKNPPFIKAQTQHIISSRPHLERNSRSFLGKRKLSKNFTKPIVSIAIIKQSAISFP